VVSRVPPGTGPSIASAPRGRPEPGTPMRKIVSRICAGGGPLLWVMGNTWQIAKLPLGMGSFAQISMRPMGSEARGKSRSPLRLRVSAVNVLWVSPLGMGSFARFRHPPSSCVNFVFTSAGHGQSGPSRSGSDPLLDSGCVGGAASSHSPLDMGFILHFRAGCRIHPPAVVTRPAFPYKLPPLRRRAPLEAGAFFRS
jgi:hypothetical protein